MHVQTNKKFCCADYVRLSREDGDKMESDSIKNQKDLIADFHIKHPELKFVDEYIDDGYSGTNFERPAFQKMMSDIDDGKINCIIVKDLSRFGRNYIEVGRYLEQIFPMIGVRVIAINDQYDSANDANNDGSQLIVPFKNLINDAYCRDVSIKIRSSLDVKRKNGQFIGSFAAYGYKKDPKDKNHLVIDEYAAEIVRTIFNLKLEGMSSLRIAQHLDEIGALPPMEYKLKCGYKFNSGFRAFKDEKWPVIAVTRILKNELYLGTMVQGKRKKINYKLKYSYAVDENEWIRVKDTHESIVPKGVFDQVQHILEMDTRTPPTEKTISLFSGFLCCGGCGQVMIKRSAQKAGGVKHFYYHCPTYKNGQGCSSHLVSEKKLEEVVLASIQLQIKMLVDADAVLDEAEKFPKEYFALKKVDAQLTELETEISKYKDLKTSLYMDVREEVVTREEFKELNDRFTEMIQKAQDQMIQLEGKKKSLLEEGSGFQPWLEELKNFGNVQKLDRRILLALIDHITVYDKENIEIHFRFEDESKQLLELAELARKEDAVCAR